MDCLVCRSKLSPFLSFGKMPIANGFLTEAQFKDEYFFDLNVAFCEKCYMVQLTQQPDRQMMFHENYAFYSSTSTAMANHFGKFAKDVMEKYKPEFVVEIGSNDGILLKHFKDAGIKHLGIEPSKNVAKVALDRGIETVSCFFDEETAIDIVEDDGQVDVIIAANVMCHISNIRSVVKGIKRLLKPRGVFIFEDPYIGDIIDKTSYDQIYDEHAFYFSVRSVQNLMSMYEMEVVDVAHQDTHGGSMRYTIAHKGEYEINDRVIKAKLNEINFYCTDKIETYERLRDNIHRSRRQLLNILYDVKGRKVVAYGATSKSTTITNYCQIDKELIECIYDTTPIKQGKFSPGAHIPVKAYHNDWHEGVDYCLLFAWNHAKEIMEKEKEFKGKWIVYVPEVMIL